MMRSMKKETTTRTGITQERVRSELTADSSSGNTWPSFICTECLFVTFNAAREERC